jgi:RND family efflux transporter MFP subunit
MAELPLRESITERLRIDRADERHGHALRRRWLPLLAVLATLSAIGAFLVTRPPAVGVAEVRAERPGEQATELIASGYVASRRRSIVAPKIPGRLEQVLVEEGDQVEAGQVLARLDDDEEQVALLQARAASGNARARLARARALLEQGRRELERTQPLVDSGALARASLDDVRGRHDAVAAEVAAAQADVTASHAAVEAAQLRVDQTIVRAPYRGTVVKKLADEGAVLAPAAISELEVGGIVELVDLAALEVEAEVSEDQLSRLHQGQPALVFLDAFPDKVFRGVVGTVRPAVERAKATAVVKVQFEAVPPGALPDMGVRVAFLREALTEEELSAEPRLRVPSDAVTERDGKTVLFVIDGDRAKEVPVTVAAHIGSDAVLEAGPPPGTKVALGAPRGLRDGRRVRVETKEK